MILGARFCRIVSNQRRCPNGWKIDERVGGGGGAIAWSRTACFRSSQRVRSCQPNYILMGHLYGKSEKSIKRPIDTWLLLSPCLRRWRYAPLTVWQRISIVDQWIIPSSAYLSYIAVACPINLTTSIYFTLYRTVNGQWQHNWRVNKKRYKNTSFLHNYLLLELSWNNIVYPSVK